MRELLDVVHQGEQLPLPVDLGLPALREAVQPLVVAQVGEHRLHCREAAPVQCSAFGAVDALLHSFGVNVLAGQLAGEERNLPRPGLVGRAQASIALRAGHASAFAAAELEAM